MRTLLLGICALVLCFAALWAPSHANASAAEGDGSGPAISIAGSVGDYLAVRKVAMALAMIGFFIGVKQLSTSEFPGERHRAESLLSLMVIIFLVLAGDRMIIRGVAGWFNLPTSALPVFWQ